MTTCSHRVYSPDLSGRVYKNYLSGDKTAIISEKGDRISYAELDRRISNFATLLRNSGISRGDRVAIFLPNHPNFTVAYFGILRCGAIVVPINILLSADELKFQLSDSESKIIVTSSDLLEIVKITVKSIKTPISIVLDSSIKNSPVNNNNFASPIGANDTAVMLYTSGTTADPKGVELTHSNLYSNAKWVSEKMFSPSPTKNEILGPGHVSLAILPLSHAFGQTMMQNALLMNGGTVSMMERFDRERAFRQIDRDKVTILAGVPSIFSAMLNFDRSEKYNLETLKFGICGGASAPEGLLQKFEAQFKITILEGYGLTETSPSAVTNRRFDRKWGSIGKAIPEVEVKIFDENDREVDRGIAGEIVIRGPNVMKSYHKRPAETAETLRGGWLHTGDIGSIDEEDFIYIIDRKNELIIRNGFNVSPSEVEKILLTHASVLESAVFGIPSDKHGEEIVAAVVLKSNKKVTENQLIQFCKEKLAKFKYPRIIKFVDQLPKGSTGKILRRKIKDFYVKENNYSQTEGN